MHVAIPLLQLRFVSKLVPDIFDCAAIANSAMLRSSVDQEQISSLLIPFLGHNSLACKQLKQVSAYLDILLKWNSRINLTAIRNQEEILTRHFGESFFAAQELIKLSTPPSAIDIGSGAGFPGLPLKILAPEINLTLVEANQKKSTFLREVIRQLGFADATVFPDRAEALSTKAGLVTLRAVEKFDSMLPIAGRLTCANGLVVLLVGRSQVKTAVSTLHTLQWNAPIPIPLSDQRLVLIGRDMGS